MGRSDMMFATGTGCNFDKLAERIDADKIGSWG